MRHRRILIINNAEKEVLDFVNPIQEILNARDIQVSIVPYSSLHDVEFSTFDGVILTASPLGNNIVYARLPYYKWLLNYEKPVFGICAGHQIIGCLFGSELLKKVESETGNMTVEIQINDEILKGYDQHFVVYQQHYDSITCPDEFIILGSSAICKVQIIRHIKKPIYCTQFHAEISNKEIIHNFVNVVIQNG